MTKKNKKIKGTISLLFILFLLVIIVGLRLQLFNNPLIMILIASILGGLYYFLYKKKILP